MAASADQRQTRGCALGLCLFAVFECVLAASTYTVGDGAGWSLGFNHLVWEQKHSFAIGDTILFNYDPTQHSVQQVSELDFQSCNVTGIALKVYRSGRDAVTVTSDNAFFICGTPGHCQLGMRVAILTSASSSSPNSTSVTPPAYSSSPGSAGAKSPSSEPNFSGAISRRSGSTGALFTPVLVLSLRYSSGSCP